MFNYHNYQKNREEKVSMKTLYMIVMMLVMSSLADADEKEMAAPVNPYNGLQEREEVYEFTEKPKVQKEGKKWVITFASKGNCDATVAIVDKEGKIIRHLASGVLGKNAPYPFQQNSLKQRIEWDGLDDGGRVVSEDILKGCKIKVGLGLQAKFERNLLGDVYDMGLRNVEYWIATDEKQNIYVVSCAKKSGVVLGRIFDKDGNYIRTFYPLSASELERYLDIMQRNYEFKTKVSMVSTIWGDKVLTGQGCIVDVATLVSRVGGGTPQKGELPEVLAKKQPPIPRAPHAGISLWATVVGPSGGTRLAADRKREELYVGANYRGALFRINTVTGELDPTWPPIGPGLSDVFVGPDDLIYIRVGAFGYGQWIVRVDRSGNPVPFDGDSYDLWEYASAGKFPDTEEKGYGTDVPTAFKGKKVKALWTGLVVHSNIHDRGLYVSPHGYIVAQMQSVCKDFAVKHGILQIGGKSGTVLVWSPEGKLLTANAVGPTMNGRGVGMDYYGNIYSVIGSLTLPTGQKVIDGIADQNYPHWASFSWGTLVKFRGQGGRYPLSTGPSGVKLGAKGEERPGSLWGYGGIPHQTGDCMCHNVSCDMDYFARYWIAGNHVKSVVVIDSNGNRMARLGRYGNIDDTDADVKAGKDGLRFAWMRAVAVSDTALYVTDEYNHRILKAVLYYSAEEILPLPL